MIIAASILLCAAAIWDAGSVAARPGKILEISIFESRHSYPEVNIIRLYDTGRYTIGPPRYERRGVIDFKRYAGQVSELPMSRTPIAFKTIGFGYLIDVRDSRGELNAAVSESGDRDQRLLAFVRSVEAAIASDIARQDEPRINALRNLRSLSSISLIVQGGLLPQYRATFDRDSQTVTVTGSLPRQLCDFLGELCIRPRYFAVVSHHLVFWRTILGKP